MTGSVPRKLLSVAEYSSLSAAAKGQLQFLKRFNLKCLPGGSFGQLKLSAVGRGLTPSLWAAFQRDQLHHKRLKCAYLSFRAYRTFSEHLCKSVVSRPEFEMLLFL